MNESKAIFVKKGDIKRNTFVKDYSLNYPKVKRPGTPNRQTNYEEELNNEVGSQCENKGRHLKNKQRYSRITEHIGDSQYCHQVLCDNLVRKHSSEVKVGQIRSVKKKKIRKIYLPEIVDNGVGSFDLSTIKKRRHKKVTSSKCVGAIFECTTGNKSKDKTHLAVTKSMGTGPSVPTTLIIVHQKERQRDKRSVKYIKPSTTAGNVAKSKGDILTHTESSSILTDIHDYLLANNIPTREVKCKLIDQVSQVPVKCSNSSKRKIKSCLKSNEITEFKSSSSLRQKYEKLMTGDIVKQVTDEKIMRSEVKGDGFDNVSKQSNTEMSIDKSIVSTPGKPSLSDSETKVIPQRSMISQDEQYYDEEEASPFYNDGIKGMFKLWSRRFHLEDDYNGQNPTSSFDLSYNDKTINSEQLQKKQKKFFIFKRKNKSKSNSYKLNKPVITGICQVKEGVMIKVEPSKPTSLSYSSSKKHKVRDNNCAQNWIQAFKSKESNSRRSVHIRWCNETFSGGSSSTVFKLINDVYQNPQTILPSKSELINKEISHGPLTRPIVPRSSFANRNYQAWMIHEAIYNTPRPKHARSNKSEQLNKKNNVEIKITNKKCFIEKSKAFSHRIEVVLHSKNIKSQNKNVSEEFIKIDLPKGFFNESSSGTDTKINGYSDEEVYNIIDYEVPSIDMETKNKLDKLNSIGDHYSSNDQDIAKKESEIYTRSPTNNEKLIPEKVDVVGVGIISRGDVDIVRRPMYNPSNETLRNDSQVSLKRVENKCEFAESYLQDYYKNLMTLSIDVYSWCADDSKVISKNAQHCQPDSNAEHDSSSSKSCPTICDDHNNSTEIITTSLNTLSSSEHTIDSELQKMGEKKYPFNLFKKIKTWTVSKVNPEPLKRAVPKDSLEVTKRRKVYARIKETANMNKCCQASKIDLNLCNKSCEGKKRVFVYDHERNTFVPPGILKFKTSEPNCEASCPKSLENTLISGSNCTILNKQFQRVETPRIPYTGSKNNLLHGTGSSSSCNHYSSRMSPKYSSRDAFKSPSPRRRPLYRPPSSRSPFRSPTCPSPPQYRRSPLRPPKKNCDDGPPNYSRQYGGSPNWRSPSGSSECKTPQYSNSQQRLDGVPVIKCDPALEGGNSYVLNRRSPPLSPPYVNRRLRDDCHRPATGANSYSSLNHRPPPHCRIPPRIPPKCPPSSHQLNRQNPCPPPLLIKVSSTNKRKSPLHSPKSGSRETLRRREQQKKFISTCSSATDFKPGCGHMKCPTSPPLIDISSFKSSIKELIGTYIEPKLSPKEVQCGDPLCPSTNLCKKNSQCEQLKLIIDTAGPLPVIEPPCGDPICPTRRLIKKNKLDAKICSSPNTPCGVSQCPTKLQNKRSPLGDCTIASVLSNALKKGFEGGSCQSSNKQTIYSGDSKFPITSVISKIFKKTIRGIGSASVYGSNKVDIDKSANKTVSPDLSISQCDDTSCQTTTLLKVRHAPCCNKSCPVASNSNENNYLKSLGITDSEIKLINKDPTFIITSIPSNVLKNDIMCVDSNTTRKQVPWEDPRCIKKKECGKKCSNTKCPVNQRLNKESCCLKKNKQNSTLPCRCKASQKPSPTNCKYNAEKEIGGVKCTSSKQTCCDDFKYYPPPSVPRNTVALDRPGPSFYTPEKHKCDSHPKRKNNIQRELKCDGPCVSILDRPKNVATKGRTRIPKILSKCTSYHDPCLKNVSGPRAVKQGGSKLWLSGRPLGDPICPPLLNQDSVSSMSDGVCCGDPRCLKTQIKAMSKAGTKCSGTNTISPHSMSKCIINECKPKNKDVEITCDESLFPKKKKFTFPWPLNSKKSNQNTNQPQICDSPPRHPPKRAIAPLVDDNGCVKTPSADFLRRNTICHSPKPCQQPKCNASCCDKEYANLGGFKLHKPPSKPLPINQRVYLCASELVLCDSNKQYEITKMHSVQNVSLNNTISSDKKSLKYRENVKDNSTTVNELYKAKLNVTSSNSVSKPEKDCSNKTELSTPSNKSESDSNLTNTVEINFKLKFKKGDKATEINFGHDGNNIKKICPGINKSPQEVYVLRDKVDQPDLKSSRKNDLNIKIIIQNYNKSTPIGKNEVRKNDVKINEISQNLSQKLCTVSTGYSDLLLLDRETIPDENNINSPVIEPTNLSVHRATIDLALSDKSVENDKSSGLSLGSIKTSLSLKTSHGVTTSPSGSSSSQIEDSAIISVNKSNTSIDKTKFEEIIVLNGKRSHTSVSSVPAHHTVSTVNEITEDESNKSKVELSHSRSLSIKNKKNALKGLGEAIMNKDHNKDNVQEFRTMLQAILTSSASNSATSKDNKKSLSKLMENNVTITNSAKRNNSNKCPSIDEGSNRSAINYSKNTCCSGNKANGCLCSLLATRINATNKYIDESQPVCCCRKKQQPISQIDEVVNCDIETRVELDFSEFNIKANSKQVEANLESKDTSIHKASKDSDKTSYDCLSKNDNYLNDQEVEILNNILDSVTQKRENEIYNVSEKSSGDRKYANQIKNSKPSLVDTNNVDKFGVTNSKHSGTSMETMFFQELKRTKFRNNIRILNRNVDGKLKKTAEVLQSYETKKAVLQIYAEKTMSESHFTAKLPKFMYKEDSVEDCSVKRINIIT